MKTKLALLTILALSLTTLAQDASPTPFDVLKLSASPTPRAAPTLTVPQMQSAMHKRMVVLGSVTFTNLLRNYTSIINAFADESSTGGLTQAQKFAAFNHDELLQIITLGWQEYNALNDTLPGCAVAPAIPVSALTTGS